jgi:glutaredoxin-related protein|tara:strand:+ start:7833 stop:9008 length:1176 start_codon:yes stop_codon:yes gene_type:complete
MEFKGRCINFELWFIEEETQDLTRIYTTLEALIKQDIDKAVQDGCNTIIGLLLYEGFLYKNTDEFYALLKRIEDYGTNKGIIKFELVCGICWDYQEELNNRNINFNIVEFDYSANAMFESYSDYPLPPWNSKSNKYLFLGGVPNRTNRITLLSKFYDAGMLTDGKASWSFFKPKNLIEDNDCRSLLDYNKQQYETFIQYAENKIDNKYFNTKEYSSANGIEWKQNAYLDQEFFKDPNYIDQKIFTNTCISVIAEGHVYPPANDFKFLTEKTWRAVVNRHPFILADCNERKQFAKNRGLDIFDNFYTHEYDINNLDGVVSNIKQFIKVKDAQAERIQEATTNNLVAFFSIINNNKQQLQQLKLKYNLTSKEIAKWFEQKSFDHLFRIPEYKK